MTHSPLLKRVLATDSTNSSALTQPADTTTEPTVDASTGYVRRGSGPIPGTRDLMMLVPVACGNADTTYVVRVYGVFLTSEGVYIHIPLYEITCTSSTAVGLSGKGVSELHRYADTIAVTSLYGTADVNIQIKQQTANGRGCVVLDMFGALFAYCQFKIDTGATHMNAICGDL